VLSRLRRHLTYANVVSSLCLFIILGGGAVAATSLVDSRGRITSCVKKRSGAVRIVKSRKKCRRGETKVRWNKTGRRGRKGSPGGGASFTGAAAGGDLTGTYPNPALASGAVTPSKFGTLPAAIVTNSVAETIGGGIQVLTFDTEELDTANVHDNATNPSRLTVPVAGLYWINATVEWSGNATGRRLIRIDKNQASPSIATDSVQASSVGNTAHTVSRLVRLAAGDFIEIDASQSTGGNLDANIQDVSINWVGP
jgi:hypothetical protein